MLLARWLVRLEELRQMLVSVTLWDTREFGVVEPSVQNLLKSISKIQRSRPRVRCGGWQNPDPSTRSHFERKRVAGCAVRAENADRVS